MILLICKECFEKKYGVGTVDGIMHKESSHVAKCFFCGKERMMIDDFRPDPQKSWLILD